MANNVNKSSLLGNLNKLKERYSKPGAIESKYRLEADIAQGTMDDINRQNTLDKVNGTQVATDVFIERMQDYSAAQHDYERAMQRADIQAAGRSTAYTRAFEREVNNYASSSESSRRIAAAATSTPMVTAARSALGTNSLSYAHLERAREKAAGDIAAARSALNILGQEGPDADPNSLRSAENQLRGAEGRAATIESRMRVLRRAGLSTESLLDRVSAGGTMVDQAYRALNSESMRESIKSGKALDLDVLNNAIKKAADDLKKAGQELADTLEDTSKSAAEVNAAIAKEAAARESLETAQSTKDIASREGKVLPPGMMGKITDFLTGGAGGKAIEIAHAVGDVFNAGARMTRHFGVNRRLERFQNQAGLVDVVNDQFDDTRRALDFDMAAMRRAAGTNALSMAAGDDARLYERTASGFDVVEAGTRGTANTVQGGCNLSPGQMVGQGAQAIANTAIAGDNLYTGSSAIRAGLATRNAARTLAESTNHVNDAINQGYVDFTVQGAYATRGMGRQREGAFGVMQDAGFRMMMAQSGIAGKDLVDLISQTGSEFGASLGGVDSRMNMGSLVTRAANAQQRGYMTAGQYLSNQSALTGVGGSAGQLDKVLKEAVAAGMDSSKNISQMVQATTTLSQNTASVGIGGANFISQSVSAATQSLSNLDPNMRAGVATNTLAKLQAEQTDTSLNLFTVVDYSRRRAASPNMTRDSMDILQQTEIATLQDIKTSKDPNKAAANAGLLKALQEAGEGDVLKGIEKETNNKRQGMMDRLDRFFRGNPSERKDIESAVNSGSDFDQLPLNMQDRINALARMSGEKSGRVLYSQLSGAQAKQGDLQGTSTAEGIATAAAQGKNAIIGAGQENIGGIQNLTAAMQNLAANFDPAKFAEAANKTAETMKVPAEAFASGAEAFAEAVKRFESVVDEKLSVQAQKIMNDNRALVEQNSRPKTKR